MSGVSERERLERRDARDRLIDLLGVGETSPLRDVVVSDELKVMFGSEARITISPAQLGVRYELRDHDGQGPLVRAVDGVNTPIVATGDGGVLELRSPPIFKNCTFLLWGAKRHALAGGEVSVREVFLRRAVRVKVGLDTGLAARIRFEDGVERLLVGQDADGAPRVVDHGRVVRVEVDGGQDGVDYDLVSVAGDGSWVVRSSAVRGMGEGVTITIVAEPAREDDVLRVRATKRDVVEGEQQVEVELLAARLPLMVRADAELAVSAVDGAEVEHAATVVIRVAPCQASVVYQLFARPMREAEVLAPQVVVRPPWTPLWQEPDGFVAVGPPVAGNGGALDLPLAEVTRDMFVVVRAAKVHAASGPVNSAMRLRQDVALYVRPQRSPELALRVVMAGNTTTGTIELLGGQPGVLHTFRLQPGEPDLAGPVYVHPRSEESPEFLKGVGATRIEDEFVIADEHAGTRTPVLATPPLDDGAVLHVWAVVARSRVGVMLAGTARIRAMSSVSATSPTVASGQGTEIVVAATHAGERLWMTRDGIRVGAEQVASGGALEFATGALTESARFEVHCVRDEPGAITVERVVVVDVAVEGGG